MIWVDPCELLDVIESSPAMVENCRSSGCATADAIVSGVAPGTLALTSSVGKSTFGRSLTGNCRYPMMPNRRIASMTNVVMTGRGGFVEVQGTAEGVPFTRAELDTLLGLAEKGITELVALQRELLAEPPAPR